MVATGKFMGLGRVLGMSSLVSSSMLQYGPVSIERCEPEFLDNLKHSLWIITSRLEFRMMLSWFMGENCY